MRIRFDILGWENVDTASAHYNLGVAEYARGTTEQAVSHLDQYLNVAARKDNETTELDPIPALIYILLIKNEGKENSMSQELVRGLRTLQDKRQDLGPENTEVASVLNFVGTLLFHQHAYDDALLFFQEELRLEESLSTETEDVSVSVTCNNIGRILQELGKLTDAIPYYERALKAEYGDKPG